MCVPRGHVSILPQKGRLSRGNARASGSLAGNRERWLCLRGCWRGEGGSGGAGEHRRAVTSQAGACRSPLPRGGHGTHTGVCRARYDVGPGNMAFPSSQHAESVPAMAEHVAYVPYAQLVQDFSKCGRWTCVACGGPVEFLGFGHDPKPRVPLFACLECGRRSDGCQTFEAHHLLYGGCALDDGVPMRCGHWLCSWARPRGACPVCGASRTARQSEAAA